MGRQEVPATHVMGLLNGGSSAAAGYTRRFAPLAGGTREEDQLDVRAWAYQTKRRDDTKVVSSDTELDNQAPGRAVDLALSNVMSLITPGSHVGASRHTLLPVPWNA